MVIQLNSLRDMKAHLPEHICAPAEEIVRETLGLSQNDAADDIDLADVFGSPMFLVEEVSDLAAVRSFAEGPSGRLSLLDRASPWFDIARWEADALYATFATVETSDGGPQWFVPREVAEQIPHVAASIRLKSAFTT